MPITTDTDGSEDVNDFLLRIRDLSRKRDIEDEERTRKLEEEIIQGRKERSLRRAERARSISPTKDTPYNAATPNSIRSKNEMSSGKSFSNGPSFQPPSSGPLQADGIARQTNGAPTKINTLEPDALPRELPQPPSTSQAMSTPSSSAAIAPSRAGTLSWQQRPSSRGSTGSSSRPLSAVTSENNVSNSPSAATDSAPMNDGRMSRSQISQSLGLKDPAWFKQTQDRGLGSAAFRKNQDDLSDTASTMGNMRLPGMSRESTAEPENRTSPAPNSVRSASPSREGSSRGISGPAHQKSGSLSPASAGVIQFPLPTMSSQRFDPPSDKNSSMGEGLSMARTLAMSPSQGRLSPEHLDRPASPTKGLGGFVQSAMLKRSDSVNKRWSAQAGPGLSRGNSIANSRGGYEGTRYPMGGITPLKVSTPNSVSRENSTETTSRPGSSHSATLHQGQIEDEWTSKPTPLTRTKFNSSQGDVPKTAPVDTKLPPPSKNDDNESMKSPPGSPSKKWSPTKASWLENAINKPDSPKVKSPAPQQPAWMAEINRAKQQRGSIDPSKGGNFKAITTGGLIRSPPPGAGYKPPGIGGLPSSFSTGVAVKPRIDGPEGVGQRYESLEITSDKGYPRGSFSPHMSPLKMPEMKADPIRKAPANEQPADSLSAKNYNPQLGSGMQSPPATKSKPATPPKFDFKSSLKSRQASGEAKSNVEPEFKNVFGNLKRTQTKNYKAPNELKDNILRGKAGLALTSGPQRTERKDEFKESILKKKEGMVVPSASTRITSASSKFQEHNVPEAIAKKHGLTRPESFLTNVSKKGADEEFAKAETLAKGEHLRDKPKPTPPEKPPSAAANAEKDLTYKGTLGGEFTSSLASMIQKGPLPIASNGKPSIAQSSSDNHDSHSAERPNHEEAASTGPQLTHATKARARGPKRRLPTLNKQDAAKDTPLSQPDSQPKLSVSENRPLRPLHVTKLQTLPPSVYKSDSRPLSNITHNNNNNRKTSQPSSPRKPSTSIAQSLAIRTSSPVSPCPGKGSKNEPSLVVKEKPMLSSKDPKRPSSPISTPEPLPDTPVKRTAPPEPTKLPSGSATSQERREPEPQELDRPTSSVKGAAAIWERSPKQPTQFRSPVKLSTQKDGEAAQEETDLESKGPAIGPVGLGIETTVPEPKPSFDRNLPSPITPSPRTPPFPGRKPVSVADRVVSTNLPSPATINPPSRATTHSSRTPRSHFPGLSDLFANLFDDYPSSKTSISIDTQAILSSRSSNESSLKIKTLRKQIFEITANGKSVPVPSHQEHILFEDCLYVCTHVFGTLAGTRTTEVYLWCGDGVPSSSIEDAQLFAKRLAKDNNGKLIILKQGKETANFFQALGGIVVTRRGSSSRPETPSGIAATYLLCGRQHAGQIAFDEVDFSPRSLCKGFPYIVSARSGKLYLWKGSGSGAEELGCARLIGMDLGLIEEIDEGQEPDAFWQSFPGGKRDANNPEGATVEHWHLKPSCENYTTRLYRIDVEAPRPKSSSGFMQWGRRGSAPAATNAATTAQIGEIIPFAQQDLMDDGVFVLDSFFEIFTILSIRSLAPAPQHKSNESAAFRAALVFAQEYGILAASSEDRPFVPISSVVIYSRSGSPDAKEAKAVPEGMKRAFRKWDDSNGLSECRVLPLTAALEATG